MEYNKFFSVIDDHVSHYEEGTITISEDIEFSMRKTVRTITHYILSRYMNGVDNKDPNTGQRRPFRNIGNAIVDLEWRAKNIDRKSIEGHATDGDHIFTLLVNKELQLWMKNNNFGKTIDDYQRKKSEYGSALLKKTETSDELLIEPVKWEHTVVDPRDISGGPKIEKNYLTVLDLKKKKDVWEGDQIDLAIEQARKSKGKNKDNRIEVLDIEGEFEKCDLYETEQDAEEDDTIGLYNVIVANVDQKKFVLYKTELTESRYKHDKRKEVEGCDFGMGVWQEVFEPQIWTNEAVIGEKEAMDIGGKVVITTNKKDVPSGMTIMNGEIIELEADEYFKPVSLSPQTFPEYQNQIDNWFANMQRDQSAYPGITGEEPKASTPAASLQLQAAQGASIFNKRRDQDGYFLMEIVVEWVLPFVVKKINKEHKLTASYSPGELKLLDEAIKNFHDFHGSKEAILSDKLVTPDMQQGFRALVDQMHQPHGDSRTLTIPKSFITLDRIKQKVRFDITDEMKDDQRELNGLATALGAMAPTDPGRAAIIEQMLEITGNSAASFPVASAPSTPAPVTTPGRTNAVLPAAQQA